MIRIQGDADARLDLEREAVDRERLLERLPQLAGDDDGRGRVHDAREEHAELVSTQPRHRVALSQRAAEAVAGLLEQVVAARVPERVVDLLEAVEVHDHDGDWEVVPARDGQRLADAVVEERPVGRSVSASCSAWCSFSSACSRSVLEAPATIRKRVV